MTASKKLYSIIDGRSGSETTVKALDAVKPFNCLDCSFSLPTNPLAPYSLRAPAIMMSLMRI